MPAYLDFLCAKFFNFSAQQGLLTSKTYKFLSIHGVIVRQLVLHGSLLHLKHFFKPKRPDAKTLGFAVPRRQPGSVGTMASRYRATAGGRPGQRGCLACGQRGWPGSRPLYRSQGMHGALGMASRWGEGGLHFLVAASAYGAGSAVAGAIGSGWLWCFYPTVSRVDRKGRVGCR